MPVRNWKFRLLVIVALTLIGAALVGSRAQAAPGQQEGDVEGNHGEPVFVTPPSSPTEVEIGLYTLRIDAISAPSETFPTFEAELFMDLRWRDPRLAFDPDEAGTAMMIYEEHNAETELDLIWWPSVSIENAVGERHISKQELIVYPDGNVEYLERFEVVAGADFDLLHFPFDTQSLEIDIESFEWDENSLVFVENPDHTGMDSAVLNSEWAFGDYTTEIRHEMEVRSDETFAEYIYKIEARRLPQFYVWRDFIPLALMMVIFWGFFFRPPAERQDFSIWSLLIVIGFHQFTADRLPILPHLTLVDGIFIIAYVFVVVQSVESIFITQMLNSGDEATAQRAKRIDDAMKWVLPALSVVALALIIITVF